MNYLYELNVYGGQEGEDLIAKVEAYSEESLLEQLRKVDNAIKKYEVDAEAEAEYQYELAKEEGII